MTIDELKKKTMDQQEELPGWGFFDHVNRISCRIKSGRFYFYDEHGPSISAAEAERRLKI